jgi:hypothetical protein
VGKLIHAAFAAILATMALSSCDIGVLFRHELLIEAPALPEAWKDLAVDSYELQWRDAEGVMRSASLEPGGALALIVARGVPQAILAYPRIGGRRLRPAGFLYPADCAEEPDALPSALPTAAALSFASGYAAEVASKLEALGLDASAYPLERLEKCWSEKGKDPWALPPWKAAKALAEAAFRATLFPAAKVRVTLPVGTWLPESPYCRVSLLGMGVQEAVLPEGLSRFYGEGETLEVLVKEESYTVLARDG